MSGTVRLKDAFRGLKEASKESAEGPKYLSTGRPKYPGAERPEATLAKSAKSGDPDFEQLKVYVRKATKKRAWRKWEDATGLDLSDLVEQLLNDYLGT